jgi:integrase
VDDERVHQRELAAASHETDPYVRLLLLCTLQFGWRVPNQLARLRWRNVRYDESGRPRAIVARGDEEAFKTSSSVVARIPADVAGALEAWKARCPGISPEAYILPWRSVRGAVDASRALDKRAVYRILRSFERRWGLKRIPPVYFRHWVKTTCRKLSDPALAALQGHRPPRDGSMRNTYDTPGIERILEEQEAEFPDGPLAVLRPPEVRVTGELSAEIEILREWKAGRIGTVELLSRLEAVRRKSTEASSLRP